MPKQVTITPEVREVLARSTVTGTAEQPVVVLPEGQLARDLYVQVDKVLKALGGKWKRGTGHVFDRPVEGELAEALRSGVAVDAKRTAEQFFTPPDLAADLAIRADIRPGMHVLEPSAGEGALVFMALRRGASVTAVERDARLIPAVSGYEATFPGQLEVVHWDFLDWHPSADTPPFDRVLMNPPFGKGAAIAHVTRAVEFLRPGGVLLAIMPPSWLTGQQRAANDFRVLLSRMGDDAYDWDPLPEGSFREADTMVSTGILTIRKGNI